MTDQTLTTLMHQLIESDRYLITATLVNKDTGIMEHHALQNKFSKDDLDIAMQEMMKCVFDAYKKVREHRQEVITPDVNSPLPRTYDAGVIETK